MGGSDPSSPHGISSSEDYLALSVSDIFINCKGLVSIMGSRLETLSKRGAILFAGMIFQYGFSFLSEVALARYLGAADFGVVAFSYSLITLVLVVGLLGMEDGIARYIPRTSTITQQREILISSFELSAPVVLLVTAAVVVGAPFWARLFGAEVYIPVLYILGAMIPLMAIVRLAVGATRGYEMARPKILLNNIIIPVSRFALIAAIALLGGRVVDFAWAYAVSYALAAVVALYIFRTHTPLFNFGHRGEHMRATLLSFSLPLVVSAIMFTLLAKVDTLLLGYLTQSSMIVGNYRVIYALSQLLLLSLIAFNFICMPVLSAHDSEDDEDGFRQSYVAVQRWVFLLTVPVFLVMVIFPEYVISITFGSEYKGAAIGLQILIAGFFVHIVAGPAGSALKAIGKTRTVMKTTVAITVLNIALNFILIPRYTILGAAFSTAVCYTLMNVVYIFYLYGHRQVWPLDRDELITIVSSAAVLLFLRWAILDGAGVSRNIGVILIVVSFSGIYLVVTLTQMVGEQERDIIRSAFDNGL